MDELRRVAKRIPVIFPIHPRTRNMLDAFGITASGPPHLKLIDPVGYHDSLFLTENARFVITDSGGIQEESTYLRIPCLTLRPNTERPITVEVGTNKLTDVDRLEADVDEILQGRRTAGSIPKYWDGRTSERVLHALLEAP